MIRNDYLPTAETSFSAALGFGDVEAVQAAITEALGTAVEVEQGVITQEPSAFDRIRAKAT